MKDVEMQNPSPSVPAIAANPHDIPALVVSDDVASASAAMAALGVRPSRKLLASAPDVHFMKDGKIPDNDGSFSRQKLAFAAMHELSSLASLHDGTVPPPLDIDTEKLHQLARVLIEAQQRVPSVYNPCTIYQIFKQRVSRHEFSSQRLVPFGVVLDRFQTALADIMQENGNQLVIDFSTFDRVVEFPDSFNVVVYREEAREWSADCAHRVEDTEVIEIQQPTADDVHNRLHIPNGVRLGHLANIIYHRVYPYASRQLTTFTEEGEALTFDFTHNTVGIEPSVPGDADIARSSKSAQGTIQGPVSAATMRLLEASVPGASKSEGLPWRDYITAVEILQARDRTIHFNGSRHFFNVAPQPDDPPDPNMDGPAVVASAQKLQSSQRIPAQAYSFFCALVLRFIAGADTKHFVQLRRLMRDPNVKSLLEDASLLCSRYTTDPEQPDGAIVTHTINLQQPLEGPRKFRFRYGQHVSTTMAASRLGDETVVREAIHAIPTIGNRGVTARVTVSDSGLECNVQLSADDFYALCGTNHQPRAMLRLELLAADGTLLPHDQQPTTTDPPVAIERVFAKGAFPERSIGAFSNHFYMLDYIYLLRWIMLRWAVTLKPSMDSTETIAATRRMQQGQQGQQPFQQLTQLINTKPGSTLSEEVWAAERDRWLLSWLPWATRFACPLRFAEFRQVVGNRFQLMEMRYASSKFLDAYDEYIGLPHNALNGCNTVGAAGAAGAGASRGDDAVSSMVSTADSGNLAMSNPSIHDLEFSIQLPTAQVVPLTEQHGAPAGFSGMAARTTVAVADPNGHTMVQVRSAMLPQRLQTCAASTLWNHLQWIARLFHDPADHRHPERLSHTVDDVDFLDMWRYAVPYMATHWTHHPSTILNCLLKDIKEIREAKRLFHLPAEPGAADSFVKWKQQPNESVKLYVQRFNKIKVYLHSLTKAHETMSLSPWVLAYKLPVLAFIAGLHSTLLSYDAAAYVARHSASSAVDLLVELQSKCVRAEQLLISDPLFYRLPRPSLMGESEQLTAFKKAIVLQSRPSSSNAATAAAAAAAVPQSSQDFISECSVDMGQFICTGITAFHVAPNADDSFFVLNVRGGGSSGNRELKLRSVQSVTHWISMQRHLYLVPHLCAYRNSHNLTNLQKATLDGILKSTPTELLTFFESLVVDKTHTS